MNTERPQHAIVIGSSIAGLTAARMLTEHFAQVTIVERDRLPQGPDYRAGVPQARHAHALLVKGQQLLEEMFPGFSQDLLDAGAIRANVGNALEFNVFGQWRRPTYQSKLDVISCSRPLIEYTIYRRLAQNSQVRFLQEHEVTGLAVSPAKSRATGVFLRNRADKSAEPIELAADLIVDASGRSSHAPEWLEALGYPMPREITVNAHPGYASRIYRKPVNFKEPWQAIYMMPEAPHQRRGAVILPMEDNRWHVTLIGMAGDFPPTDEEGFLAFARSLPDTRIYDALLSAEPLTDPVGYRKAENRLRCYDSLSRHLEGFLLCGDSVYALNPVYGQGMTVASMGAQALDRTIRHHRRQHGAQDQTGLAATFQKELAKVISAPWQMATGQDRRWRGTEGADELDRMTQVIQGYMDMVQRVMMHNPRVAEAFFHVMHMMTGPEILFRPDILAQVLIGSLHLPKRQTKSAQPNLTTPNHVHQGPIS